MRRSVVLAAAAVLLVSAFAGTGVGRDKPYGSSTLNAFKKMPLKATLGAGFRAGMSSNTTDLFSKVQIERFRCESAGDPTASVDISCNTAKYGQNWAPDNELAIAVDPEDPDHLLAGSNDYFYRFNNATGARQAIVPTGFFTSFDGGETWIDGQVPMQRGNGAGDPAPAFDAKHGVALMAQLENVGGQGGPFVSQGNVTVSRSMNGGVRWQEPVVVFQGTGAGIGPANQAVFYDKEWLTVDNNPDSPFYGRAYVTTTKFVNGLFGSYAESPIYLSYSDDGGLTWSRPREISGSHPSCTYQETGGGTDCDEDQFSIPEVAPDGTLYVHYLNGQNDAEWEVPFDFDSQLMLLRSNDGGVTFDGPFPAVQLEDGLSDMPYSVIGRQTIWGHQIRWTAVGTLSVNPTDPEDVSFVFADRGTANPNATEGCFYSLPGEAPDYDPCDAGPSLDTDVVKVRSTDGGDSWSGRQTIDGSAESAWFAWADHTPDGRLVVAYDEDTAPAPADTFRHVLWSQGGGTQALGPLEHPDVSVTHWAGQYRPQDQWPAICGPQGYSDDGIPDAEGKDCNVFHGDYTGLAVDSLGRAHVVWTGLNAWATSPQVDFYTGDLHDGYRQDAMYARRTV